MAKPTIRLITALRETADHLNSPEATYKWSSFAHCNCGHLVKTVTGLDSESIQTRAMLHQRDWTQQARVYQQTPKPFQPDYGDDRPPLDEGAWEPENIGACSLTGMSLDIVFQSLEAVGLDANDVQHLERLSDPEIRQRLGTHNSHYPHNVRQNVIDYLNAWADILEEQHIAIAKATLRRKLHLYPTDPSLLDAK